MSGAQNPDLSSGGAEGEGAGPGAGGGLDAFLQA